MRRSAYQIAVCGISVAAGLVFLTLAAYLPVARLGMLACSTVALFVPYAMGSVTGGLLSYAATAVLAFFVAGGQGPVIAGAYACFFGLQPLLICLLRKGRVRLVPRLLIGAAFAALVIFLLWRFVGLLELLEISSVPLWLFEALGIPCYLLYQLLMERVYLRIGYLCERFGRR